MSVRRSASVSRWIPTVSSEGVAGVCDDCGLDTVVRATWNFELGEVRSVCDECGDCPDYSADPLPETAWDTPPWERQGKTPLCLHAFYGRGGWHCAFNGGLLADSPTGKCGASDCVRYETKGGDSGE